MNNEPNQVMPEASSEAALRKGASSVNHEILETAQATEVNARDAIIPSEAPTELSKKQVEAEAKQEEDAGLPTTHGYVIDEAGMLNNFAIEPPMYVEGEEPKT